MQLNQPIPPSYSDGQGQYDFILEGNKKSRRGGLLPGGGSRKSRTLTIVLGGAGVLVLIIIIILLLFSSNTSSTKPLIGIAQTQNELVRVSAAGVQQSRDVSTRAFAQTVNSVVASDELKTTSYLKSRHIKVSNKVLIAKQDPQTDADLKTADAAQVYDEELTKVLEQQLNDYKAELSTAYKGTTSVSQRTMLNAMFNQVVGLLKNAPATSS